MCVQSTLAQKETNKQRRDGEDLIMNLLIISVGSDEWNQNGFVPAGREEERFSLCSRCLACWLNSVTSFCSLRRSTGQIGPKTEPAHLTPGDLIKAETMQWRIFNDDLHQCFSSDARKIDLKLQVLNSGVSSSAAALGNLLLCCLSFLTCSLTKTSAWCCCAICLIFAQSDSTKLCFYATGMSLDAVWRRNDSSDALTVLPADQVFISLHEAQGVEHQASPLPAPSLLCLSEPWRRDGLTERLSLCGKRAC